MNLMIKHDKIIVMFFLYCYWVIKVMIYVDLVMLLNFLFDLLLLFGVAVILRRQTNLKRLLLGALVGGVTILVMFVEVSSMVLFLVKVVISVIMCLVVFGYKNIRYTLNNLFYLYTSSIILGGGLYLINLQCSYRHEGLMFYYDGLGVNFVVLLILSPVIIYAYIKQGISLKNNYSNYYNIDIYLDGGEVICATSFLDTGNKLEDPYKRRPIILINKDLIKLDYNLHKLLLVPYESLNNHGLLKCIIPKSVYIQGVGFRDNFLVGLSNEEILIDGVDCILSPKLLEKGTIL